MNLSLSLGLTTDEFIALQRASSRPSSGWNSHSGTTCRWPSAAGDPPDSSVSMGKNPCPTFQRVCLKKGGPSFQWRLKGNETKPPCLLMWDFGVMNLPKGGSWSVLPQKKQALVYPFLLSIPQAQTFRGILIGWRSQYAPKECAFLMVALLEWFGLPRGTHFQAWNAKVVPPV